ncbi:MAG: hypothetical protein WC028_28665 [Candidatus Obscuribacterales bacterium]
MSEEEAKDQGDSQIKAKEVKPLVSPDAQAIATPSAGDKQLAEVERTNQSSGSIAELALKTRGLSREQIAAQMDAQGDSISIDYGNGQEVSRKTGLTEKALVQMGGKTYDAQTLTAYEMDQSKIAVKPVEMAPRLIKTGLDYNTENVPFAQKLANFVQSAEARLMDPEGQKAYVQDIIDKVVGVGQGLNLAKEEVKDTAKQAAVKAWTALNDGSVASFFAQPNAINEPLFKTLGTCFDGMKKDPNAVNKILTIMGRELEEANNKYSRMTPAERGVQDGRAMFFFINPSGGTEGGELALKVADGVATHVDVAVTKTIQEGMKAVEKLATESPEHARKARQMLCDFAREAGLTPQELETIGVPRRYFDSVSEAKPVQGSETLNAMSKADGLGGSSDNIKSGKQEIRLHSEQGQEHVDIAPKPRTLTPVQARDWYNKAVDSIDAVEKQMCQAGKSIKEIFETTTDLRNRAKLQARELMADQALAKSLPPIKTPEEVLQKYGGDYAKAIDASKRTNAQVNEQIEIMRQKEKET